MKTPQSWRGRPYYEAKEPLCDDPLIPRQVWALVAAGVILIFSMVAFGVQLIRLLA